MFSSNCSIIALFLFPLVYLLFKAELLGCLAPLDIVPLRGLFAAMHMPPSPVDLQVAAMVFCRPVPTHDSILHQHIYIYIYTHIYIYMYECQYNRWAFKESRGKTRDTHTETLMYIAGSSRLNVHETKKSTRREFSTERLAKRHATLSFSKLALPGLT